MKYTKTAVAVAVAAGFATLPMMASAETTLSGIVEVKFAGQESDDDDEQQDISMQANDIRVGVVSEHELNSGLIGYGSIKLTVDDLLGEIGGADAPTVEPTNLTGQGDDGDDVALEGTVKADDIYVGIKGGFGDIRLGEIPLAIEYGQLANDIHDVSDDVGDAISYTGAFGPVGLGLNYSTENDNDSDLFGVGLNFALAGFNIGLGFQDQGIGARYSAGASYAIAGFTLAAQYWVAEEDFDPQVDVEAEEGDITNTDFANFDLDDANSYAVKAGYSIAGISFALTYSVLDAERSAIVNDGVALAQGEENSVIRLDAGYDLGGGTSISTRIDNSSTEAVLGDDPDDVLAYRIMLAKTF